jgi:hypothetical protein
MSGAVVLTKTDITSCLLNTFLKCVSELSNVQLALPFVQVQKMIGQFASILHTTTCDLYFTSYVNNKVNAENDAWDMNQFDGFRDDSDCSRKVHFTSFYRTHGVEQALSDAGSYAHALLFPQDQKATVFQNLDGYGSKCRRGEGMCPRNHR